MQEEQPDQETILENTYNLITLKNGYYISVHLKHGLLHILLLGKNYNEITMVSPLDKKNLPHCIFFLLFDIKHMKFIQLKYLPGKEHKHTPYFT